MAAEVVQLDVVGDDIAGALRSLADCIDERDEGEFGDLRFVVVVTVNRDGTQIGTYGFGPHSALEALGALSRVVSVGIVTE